MDEFDLARLTDFDFEKLCKDIFEEVLGIRLEIFAPGADAGVDLRGFSPTDKASVIVQCKHWAKAGRAKLIKHYASVESEKVRKLQPGRYLLATTADLTVGAKTELQKVIGPSLKSPDDIYGLHEIAAFLRTHPEVVSRHIRLWLSSAAVLSGLLNRDIAHRTRGLLEDIEESLRVYVPGVSHDEARRVLEEEHACVIAGLPGVGKTTLAHVLLAEHAAEGYAIVDASSGLGDIDRIWSDGEKQIFFVDDFLGQTALDGGRADSLNREIRRLLRNCRTSENKRVVLTSREYILAEARDKYERLSSYNLDPVKAVVNLNDCALATRAEILYNHLYFSDLTAEQCAAFTEPAAYEPLIRHPNYSPRLLEHALIQVVDARLQDDAVAAVRENLDHPWRLWDRLVETVLTDDELNLLLVMFSLGRQVEFSEIERVWLSMADLVASAEANRRFRRALKRLEHTMIRRVDIDGKDVVHFHNPSIRDYLRSYIAENPGMLRAILDSAIFYEQVENLWRTTIARIPDLDEGVDLVIRALLRLASRDDSGGEAISWANLGMDVLQVSPDARLEDLTCELLEEITEEVYGVQEGDLLSVARRVASSETLSLKTYSHLLAEQAVAQKLAEAYSWEEMQYARGVVEELASYVGLDFEPELSEREFGLADRILDSFIEGAVPEYVDRDELAEVLDYWSLNVGEGHPGMEGAQAYLDANVPKKVEKKEYVNRPGEDGAPASIAAMFRSLQNRDLR